ncbi:MAG TPA: aminomethyl-transferring glycine dehydrogenase [Candidatus Tidjanibacter faecipullorum]|uniref:glycine dehydrogenase (aminomethyl-transferring) n=1 Tax=Candidatus Tidjanibacter faecipullorum TaxID=2838766 RepID=A0A9D2IKL5_9BACT|nr:aminomethyl-transferring glycine dehydrogenase [Candidatus Tidjanibacter faecipullorum]
MSFDKFADRHIGVTTDKDLQEMLKVIGVSSVEELISQVIPATIRLRKPIALPAEGMTEYEFAAHVRELAAKNHPMRSFIGMGWYPTATPAVITRNVFENAAWYTSYTPYQAEISQGRLEALLNFQTMTISLTGMEIGNCSLLDDATAAAEAMLMMFALRSREQVKNGCNQLFVDEDIYPQVLDLLMTRSEPFGIEIIRDNYAAYTFTGKEFGTIVQYPSADGAVRDYAAFAAAAHAAGAKVTAVCDLMSLVLLQSPGEWGADIAVGSAQRFGLPMGFGGPTAGFMTTKEAFKRNMPGRIIGVSVDRMGNKALRMALQTREQHIKREKATSNICTASALMASMSGFYAVYHGAEGLRRIARHIHSHTVAVAEALRELGYQPAASNYFDTLEVKAEAAVVQDSALARGINFFYPDESTVRMSFDEVTTADEVAAVVAIFAEAAGKKVPKTIKIDETKCAIEEKLLRKDEILTAPVFDKYHSETEMMRYIKRLERRDISLADSMIPLGSCTMKLNAAVEMMPLSLAEFTNIHPYAPASQVEGYLEMIRELEHDLAAITGFAGVSLQPESGATGEYTGLMVIRAYHQDRGQGYRTTMLIPASAHGTNPASAAMAGMKIVTVKTDEHGNIDVEDFKAKAAEHAAELCGAMITYPSTHGVFESKIRELVDAVHEAGGLVFMDGANMNAQVGLTNPGYIGADVCHLNLHKTFAMPHGGGGPGVGPICVAEHLVPFLPSHSVVATGGDKGITAVAAAPYGNALLLPITYGYIKMLGADGLRRVTEMAIVNANYMAKALESEFRTYYTGENGRVGHEMILDLQNFRKDYGVEVADIARRLMDYGFHAPTLSFPVHDTLMVEPTESESKEEMDRFIEALVSIKRECAAITDAADNVVVNAPHTALEIAGEWNHPYSRMQAAYPLEWVSRAKFFPYVSKIDNGYGDRNLVCTCCDCEF